ncbi:tRNA pseudouridine(38-40) synthase TruA [Mycoplasmatota bacterium zrk1]
MAYRIKCTVSYDGTNYNGWQKQVNQPTIQGQIEASIQKLHNGLYIKTHGASRTDSGVHANNQVFHFDTELDLAPYRWKIAINNYLSDDIYIKKVEIVGDDFHARYDVKKKEYKYYVNLNEYNPLLRDRMHFERRNLNVELMKKEVKEIIGRHNFKSFTGGTIYDNYVREIFDASITNNNGILEFTFIGSGFLRYMVRTIVGTLIEIGYGKKNNIKEILISENRNCAGKSESSVGLYLDKIWY